MSADGQNLESLVRFIEEIEAPEGFKVVHREKVYEDGVQIAELDIQVKGKIRTSEFSWLIECRDRPSDGPQSGAWIEQLLGRKQRFHFDRVTAVSTTGFSAGAIAFAQDHRIELREVKTLSREAFSDWLLLRFITRSERRYGLDHALLVIDEGEPTERKLATQNVVESGEQHILRSTSTGAISTVAEAFMGAMQLQPDDHFEGLQPNGDGRHVRLNVEYTNDDDHFVVDTIEGPVRIRGIAFVGTLDLREEILPLVETKEYKITGSGQLISQTAIFQSMQFQDMELAFELHRLGESGATHVTLRRVK